MQLPDERATGLALHARMLAGDRVASDEVFEQYCGLLVVHLQGYKSRKDLFSADDTDLWDAAIDAIQSYVEKEDRFDPSRGKSLAGYLKMAAEGDLKNILSRRRPPHGARVVPLFDDDRNNDPEDPRDEIADVDDRLDDNATHNLVADAAETDEECVVLELMLAGERSNMAFAEKLGSGHLSPTEAAKYVNKIKERLRKRLKRRYGERVRNASAD